MYLRQEWNDPRVSFSTTDGMGFNAPALELDRLFVHLARRAGCGRPRRQEAALLPLGEPLKITVRFSLSAIERQGQINKTSRHHPKCLRSQNAANFLCSKLLARSFVRPPARETKSLISAPATES